jgi:L-threonylcarbamoyladenylate synthase
LGGLSVEQIESVIGKATVQLNASSNPQAPGQLKSHYAPHKKLILESLSTSIKKYQLAKVGVLCFQEKIIGIDPKNQRILSPTGSLEIAAQHLFSALRELDKLDIEFILAEEVLDEGIGRAINDRLRRASIRQ